MAKARNPDHPAVAPEPGPLALGVTACIALHFGDRGVFVEGAVKDLQRLFVANGTEGARLSGISGAQEGFGFGKQAGIPHLPASQVEALVEKVTRRVEANLEEAQRPRGNALIAIEQGERLFLEEGDFEGADEFLGVGRGDVSGRSFVPSGKEAVEEAWTASLDALETIAGLRVAGRGWYQSVDECF